jgi:sugar phosphate isomerase/epimerase
MARPVTLFTGQWAAKFSIEKLAKLAGKNGWGYDGLELLCAGDHFEVDKALSDPKYCSAKQALLAEQGLKVFAISNHLVGQCVCDPLDQRHKSFVPPEVWGLGLLPKDPEAVRQWAANNMMNAARAAKKMGIKIVNGFTGSLIWHLLYSWPPVSKEMIAAGYADFAKRWKPILDVFLEQGVMFGLEVHPTEIAFDWYTTEAALEAIEHHPAFGINFDPSHFRHQGVDPAAFVRHFGKNIVHVHMKDVKVRERDGRRGGYGSLLEFGDSRRPWDFVSLGHGSVDFDDLIRALNEVGYQGPLSNEWEDGGMLNTHGAKEALDFTRRVDFPPSDTAFDEFAK